MLDDLAPFRASVTSDDRYLLLGCHTGRALVTCRGRCERLAAGQGVLVPPGQDAAVTVAPGSAVVPVRIDPAEVPHAPESVETVAPGERWNDRLLHHYVASVSPMREPGYRQRDLVAELYGAPVVSAAPVLPRSAGARQVATGLLRDPACPWTVARWAAQVNVGERTLHRTFVTETGMTFAAWRRECRLKRARDLLVEDPDRTAVSVGAAVGFGTPTGFLRAFRARFGMTPAAWRAGVVSRAGSSSTVSEQTESWSGPDADAQWAAADTPPGLDHGFHVLLWVWRGHVQVTAGDRTLEVSEGQVAWMPAYRDHRVRLSPGAVVLPLTFTVADIDPGDDLGPADVPVGMVGALLQHAMANQCGLEPEDYDRTQLLTEPWMPGKSPTLGRQETLGAVSSIIFAASSSPARRVADALLRDLRDPRTLAQWAEFAGVAPRTLNDGFREATGMTLLQWRTTVRLQTARRLLAAGSTPSAAARSVGYRHLSQFSRDFTSRYGMRPREFAGER